MGETLIEYEALDFEASEQAFYISCPSCEELHSTDKDARAFRADHLTSLEATHDSFRSALRVEQAQDRKRQLSISSTEASITNASTIATNSEVATPAELLQFFDSSDDSKASRKRRATGQPSVGSKLRHKLRRLTANV